ncbi:MAG: Holliday junction branch migration protein RuvA [Lachnospiraceae bacterium]|nr:Holliday junction branch migration protein RuvA [Lachnospiraceae bacterium]
MFAFVHGTLDSITSDECVIDLGGFGVNVGISARTAQSLPGIDEEVKLYTYTSVREDAISLYGFLSRDELDLFRRLIGVSGIGPKGGLSILSELDPDAVRFAILSGDAKAISRAPGIGPKTAQRVILELKDKVKLEDDAFIREIQNGGASPAPSAGMSPERADAVAALAALGYSSAEARKAVLQVEEQSGMDSGAYLSAALKFLF